MGIKEIVQKHIEELGPKMSKRGLGFLLHEKYPELFKDPEDARGAVRRYCGMRGKASRNYLDNNKHFVQLDPEILVDNMFYRIEDENAKIGIFSDVHVPFHDINAVETAVKYCQEKKIDILILNGDIFDHNTNSKHERDPKKRDLEEDYYQYLTFLFEIRCAFPHAKIIFKIGNHELWWDKHFMRNGMGAMLNINKFDYAEVMELKEHNIICLKDYTTIQVGDYNILHGHEYRGGAGSERPAKWLSLRTAENSICGHWHKTDNFYLPTHSGKELSFYTAGCLALLNPKYMPYNKWNHGFVYMEKEGDQVTVNNLRIRNNKVY